MDTFKPRKLFDDDESDNDIPKITTPEEITLPPEEGILKLWTNLFKEGTLDDLSDIPKTSIKLPIRIVNEIKELRQQKFEYGGKFIFIEDTISSYTFKQGSESDLDMNIDPEERLMYHTHPPYTDRFNSPPSEIDIATLFKNSVNSKIVIPHLVFAEEGIYLIYCHPQIINSANHISTLKNSFDSAISYDLKDAIQDLRILLGYISKSQGPTKVIQPKIDLTRFLEIINKMGFITELKEYPKSESELIFNIPNNNNILIGGGNAKVKVFYNHRN